MVTIRDVALRAGTSVSTVSAVLSGRSSTIRTSDATRARVVAAAAELGYTPNRAARALRTAEPARTVVLYLGYQHSSHYVTELVRGVQGYLTGTPYRLSMEPYEGDHLHEALARGLPPGTAGVLVTGTTRGDDATLATLPNPAAGLPLVVVGRPAPSPSLTAVFADQRTAARAAVRHLLELGHRRIALVTRARNTAAIEERVQGYSDALGAAGVPFAPDLVVETEFTEAGGHNAMRTLLARSRTRRPTAVFAAGDVLALGALQAAREAGVVPGVDVAVVGFDDLPVAAYIDPPLTTVHLPVRDMGEVAARVLVGQIEGHESRPQTRVLPAPLVLRGSAAPPVARSRATSLRGAARPARAVRAVRAVRA
jgi:LacI family transcriptional regulator